MDENIDISEVEPRPEPSPSLPSRRANRFSAWKAIQTILSLAFVTATLFTLWTPANLFSNQLLENMMRVFQGPQPEGTSYPTLTPAPRPRIGIVSGHMGNDS